MSSSVLPVLGRFSVEKQAALGGLRAQGKFRQWSLGWFGMVGVDWGSLSIGEVEGLMG